MSSFGSSLSSHHVFKFCLPTLLHICSRHVSRFKKRVARDTTIYNYVSQSRKATMAYGFGNPSTGALGIKRLLLPEKNQVHFKEKSKVSYPIMLDAFDADKFSINRISCGFGFTLFICKSSSEVTVFGSGLNSDGQLGQHLHGLKATIKSGISVEVLPDPQPINLPHCNPKLVPVDVACGRAHSMISCRSLNATNNNCLTGISDKNLSDTLLTMGNNTFGQAARKIIEGEIYNSSTASITRVILPYEGFRIKQIVCGQDHSLVLSDKGEVYSCGLSTDGQTGLGHYREVDSLTRVGGLLNSLNVVHISSFGDTVLALTKCGQVFAWGNNEYGQIWPVDEIQVASPTLLPVHDAYQIPEECRLEDRCGSNEFRPGRISSVAAAGSMCGLLDEFGQVFVWGFGRIGLGPLVEYAPRPTMIPPYLFPTALPTYSADSNLIHSDSSSKSSFSPSDQKDSSSHKLVGLYAGLHHFVARSSHGLLWSWGAPRGCLSCLGLGDSIRSTSRSSSGSVSIIGQTYPAQIALPAEALDVSCGVDHTFVLASSFI